MNAENNSSNDQRYQRQRALNNVGSETKSKLRKKGLLYVPIGFLYVFIGLILDTFINFWAFAEAIKSQLTELLGGLGELIGAIVGLVIVYIPLVIEMAGAVTVILSVLQVLTGKKFLKGISEDKEETE